MLSLNAGKHVLCEKPLTINEKQSQKLFATAKEKNLFFMVGVWSRFFESYKLLKQRIDEGDLGEIKEIDVEFGFALANTERLFLKAGGGSVLDLGIYPIQIALWVFREMPSRVMAFGKLNDDGLDMEYNGEFIFPNGGVAKFKVSCLTPLTNSAKIKGTKGTIVVSLPFLQVSGYKFMSYLPTEICQQRQGRISENGKRFYGHFYIVTHSSTSSNPSYLTVKT
jgi:dihydrodiol dehydrogenase / D-xylose 1-dehydrogenase (NADP)